MNNNDKNNNDNNNNNNNNNNNDRNNDIDDNDNDNVLDDVGEGGRGRRGLKRGGGKRLQITTKEKEVEEEE